jgi:hypothetical protein
MGVSLEAASLFPITDWQLGRRSLLLRGGDGIVSLDWFSKDFSICAAAAAVWGTGDSINYLFFRNSIMGTIFLDSDRNMILFLKVIVHKQQPSHFLLYQF